ncbi:MAM domain-containing glycosylphosphatidylinositol anchor protein 1 isoform X2 [Phlebotomus papatasi]|uniref:MAM domain-containing glycosylphosphatidylinositol anchor protein 1 isoform X2 n=1 Tax=Phlebotomus papatasi TaxID=29031 RepID=UPI00248408F0|nr:MAM domain-containing glycosylphosphatidylinositol anchor protein 1 isoform X2 [Phlebotomus papatasi]
MMEFWKYVLLISLVIGFIAPGLSKPANIKDAQDDYDYENMQKDDGDDYIYDDDENLSVDKSYNTEYNRVPQGPPPVLEVLETEVNAKPGETARLVCRAKNLSNTTVVSWNFGDTLLTMGQNKLSSNNRISVDRDTSLIIENVNQSDDGLYTCKIFPHDLSMKVKLVVSRSPSVSIFERETDVSGENRTYREGDRIILECRSKGNPEPTINWSSHGLRLDRVDGITEDKGKLVIERAEHHHSRIYQCLATNGIGEPAHATVTINIQYSPKITGHKHEFNTGEGYDAELFCNFKSDPAGRGMWSRDWNYVTEGQKYRISEQTHGHHNRTVLLVRKVNKSDLGFYQCLVENSLGRDTKNISLIYEPEPAHFDGYELQVDHLVLLNWTVRSVQPLSEILLYYQKTNDKQWTSVKPIVAEKHKEHSGIWVIQHRVQLSPGTWHARVKSRNTEGWSKYSEAQQINVPTNSTETSGATRILFGGFPSNLVTILVASVLFCVRWT